MVHPFGTGHDVIRRATYLAVFSALILVPGKTLYAEERWAAEFFLGAAHNFDTNLTLKQSGHPDLSFNARYETRPFETPLYYALRLSKWTGDKAWGVWLLHHKIFLKNPPSEVQHFSVTHGFNILALDRAIRRDALIYRFGAGAVITHTQANVRDVRYNGPYEFAGVALHGGVAWHYPLTRPWYLSVEGMGVLAYANTKPSGTPALEARISNVSLHALVGIGYRF